ncbi:hypothetical protein G8B24_01320 [Limosilactobacillus reuteri]|uniref:restriction endonuclease subunit S n=1 Tax=Limosilactobacillus reuteri TaxID=1598 RepID=UPI001F5A1D74|nr:restriction endonuclease subunit S [Limosilactobacillus reuteri]UNL39922.1 hypothetical protein G8B24_01320 [Limosilactobacillus reuteri]
MKYRLGDLVQIKYGKDHKKLNAGNIPVYGTGGLMRRVNDFIYDGDSVLIPRKGSLNNVMYVTNKFWTVDTMFWTKIDKNKILPKYLYYCLSKIDLSTFNVGSAVPSLTIKILNEITLEVPSLQIQNEIISKIKPIEDKIRLNNKINDNLVELINLIYLKFCADFPAKEKVSLDNVFNTSTKTFNVNENKNINIWHFSIPNFDCNKQPQCESTNSIKSNKKKVNSFGVLVSKLNPNFKRIWAPNLDFYSNYSPIASPEFIQINGNSQEEQALIFCILNSEEYTDFLVSNATGSTNSRQRVKPKIAVSYIIPFDLDKKKGLESLVSPILKDIQQREFENTKLQIIKDTLLNKYF